MSFLISLFFIVGCLSFENQFSIDRDGDGLSIYDGDCDDNDINITLVECTDDDNDGQSEYQGDCDDENPFVYTGIAYKDDINKEFCMKDVDKDGFGDINPPDGIIDGSDCDDNRDNVNEDANEICDELDNDCDEDIDEEPIDGTIFYIDQDDDGFGSMNVSLSKKLCTVENGYVEVSTDCDDENSKINPEVTEICDEKDNDCDGLIDGDDSDVDVTTGLKLYVDSDGDGFGDRNTTAYACELYEGLVENLDDCDDENEDISPNSIEICDGIDNDCDNKIDDNDTVAGGEGSGLSVFYRDVDNDGYGNTDLMVERCIGIDGYVTDNTDCDDTKFNVNFGRNEICDGIDNDCDGLVDDSDDSVTETTTFYRDVDGDGFGNGNTSDEKCLASEGFVENSSDCEDGNAEIFPNAVEICDGLDNDCDDLVDDDDNSVDVSVSGIDLYFDFDGDGIGVEDISEVRCSATDRFVAEYGDCDDSEETVFVGAAELCDGLNNDCSEDGDLTSLPFDEIDNDGDGFVECEVVEWRGSNPPLGGGDCDDEDILTFPGSAELDSETLCMRDSDGDGYGDETSSVGVELGSDCDDGNDAIHPNAEELCDGLKNDCLSEQMSDEELDLDGDGFVVCDGSDWVGSKIDFDDCNDNDGSVYPNAEELCDGIVTDCRSPWYGTGDVRYIERDQDGDGAVACEIVASGWLGEGSPISGDCDDNDPLSTAKEFDGDCDRILTENDCDDNNALDKDCDGVDIDLDCDDNNAELGSIQVDSDCDGIITENDCNEENPNDQDCDGIITENDCNDEIENIWSNIQDKDCNGYFDPIISSGTSHSCILKEDLSLFCWGNDNNVQASPSGTFIDISAGDSHTCGIKTDNSVSCWIKDDGYYNYGQVTDTPSGSFVDISAGFLHTCGIKINGTVECWGINNYGQSSPPSGAFVDISAGTNHSCAIKIDGTINCWGISVGLNEYGQVTDTPSGSFVVVSAGSQYTCGIRTNGTVECWGGQRYSPSGTFIDISAGDSHTCGIRTNGTVECWGYDYNGQSSPPSGSFVDISSGYQHTCGIEIDGSVECWGDNTYGAINTDNDNDGIYIIFDCDDHDPNSTAIEFDADCDGILTENDCDDNNAIDKDCDGINTEDDCDDTDLTLGNIVFDYDCDGILTDEDCDDNDRLKPNFDFDCDDVISPFDCDDSNEIVGMQIGDSDCNGILDSKISAGYFHTCGIKLDSTVTCWSTTDQFSPLSGSFVRISSGSRHTCGIRTNGTVECWGSNNYVQSSPPDGPFIDISTGYHHTCGIKIDGTVECWGRDNHGQSSPPYGTFIQISSGDFHTCGMREDGSVTCWGAGQNNSNPYHGHYPLYGQASPPIDSFIEISAGDYHTCGIKIDGTVECWGRDKHGQSSPPNGSFVDISAAANHSCGIRTNGSVECWGSNFNGESSPTDGLFLQISVGGNFSCGIKEDGDVECWGSSHGEPFLVDNDDDGINVMFDCDDFLSSLGSRSDDLDCDGYFTQDDCDDNNPLSTTTQVDSDCDGIFDNWLCNSETFGSVINIDSNCDGIIPTALIEISDELTCVLKEDNNILCKNMTQKRRFLLEGNYENLDVFKNRLCAINTNHEVHCWNEYGTELISNSIYEHQDIAVYTDGYCGLINQEVYCQKFETTSEVFPSLLYKFTSIKFYINENNVDILCGLDNNKDFLCWGKDGLYKSDAFISLIKSANETPVISSDNLIDFDYSNMIGSNLCFITSLGRVICSNDSDRWIDSDKDGLSPFEDCDDTNKDVGFHYEDIDCDGIINSEDCDPTDGLNEYNDDTIIITYSKNEDFDCDGIPTEDDCNDNNNLDKDCDGFEHTEDCDDTNQYIFPGSAEFESDTLCMKDEDHDGYGDFAHFENVISGIDCDDTDSNNTNMMDNDFDCDGVLTENDCDDNNANLTARHQDIDCDGILTENDCDDNNNLDKDCDGFEYTEDCDDTNQYIFPGSAEFESDTLCMKDEDNDGYGDFAHFENVISGIDCDDTDSNNTNMMDNDFDCDGILTENDCDDSNYYILSQQINGRCNIYQHRKIASGLYFHCGIRERGSVTCWGNDYNGETFPPDGPFIQISSGDFHTCGIRLDGSVECWGYDYYGQSSSPNGPFIQISSGANHTCAIRTDSSLNCWGNNSYGQSSPPNGPFIQISSGEYHTCGIRPNTSVTCWGKNWYGESYPPDVSFLQISSGGNHSCGLRPNGMIQCWGRNNFGQSFPPSDSFVQISAGYSHTCGIRENGSSICWGSNSSGESYLPPESFIEIYAGFRHTCGLKIDGTVTCWGSYAGGGQIITDRDNDGINVMLDCEDYNHTSTRLADDFDCDGILTEDDCDDDNSELLSTHIDFDCDGFINNEDCDSYNGNDDDCDGIINEEDLYPNNPNICLIPNDFDCDGFDINEDCDDSDNRYGSVENDTDCDGLFNNIDPDSSFADGDLDGVPYSEDCDDLMWGVSQYDENGDCTLAICLNENNEEILTEGQSQTNLIYGEATITLTSYEGWEQHQFAEGLSYGARNCFLDWDITGIPNVNPNGCEDCIFTFELTRTPNPFENERVPENVDMNDGTCSFFETWQESPPPFSYGYAEDYNGYGPALFYDGGDGFYPWIVPSQTEYPDESSLLYDETTGHFSYSIGFEDYLYSPCE